MLNSSRACVPRHRCRGERSPNSRGCRPQREGQTSAGSGANKDKPRTRSPHLPSPQAGGLVGMLAGQGVEEHIPSDAQAESVDQVITIGHVATPTPEAFRPRAT